MSSKAEPTTLFLDYDGTLHDCLRIYAPAFWTVHRELTEAGLEPPQSVPEVRLKSWLGLSVQAMWDDFMPQLSRAQQAHYGARIGAEMFRLVQAGQAALYPGTEAALTTLLIQKVHMVFLSNCTRSYMEEHRRHFRLDTWFRGFLCSEDFQGRPKWEIYQAVKENYPGRHIIIGDRRQDMEIATCFQLPSIGCSYGYGTPEELDNATLRISGIHELPEAVEALRFK